MEIGSFVKFTFIDETSLQQYLLGEIPGMDEVQRRIWLKGREQNRFLPDHYYRAEAQESVGLFTTMAGLLTEGLGGLAGTLLELEQKRMRISGICARINGRN